MKGTFYRIKNWEKYQHYKDRTPPWIKLHYELITSKDWLDFNDDSKLLAIVCMILASRADGVLEADISYIKKVAHLQKNPDLKPLIDSGFLVLASTTLADASTMQADAIIEERRGEERRKEEENKKQAEDLFLEFYNAYPRKEGKVRALTAYRKVIAKTEHHIIMAGLEKYKKQIQALNTKLEYIKHPATWLNGEHWNDVYQQAEVRRLHWN